MTAPDAPARRRLILHGGINKTGTTSLQIHLHRNRAALLDEGILYPDCPSDGVSHRHLWLAQSLRRFQPDLFDRMLAAALSEARPDTHTILLSNEGLYNHWFDFAPDARARLRALGEAFDLEVWIWLRDPVSQAGSYYAQTLWNPPGVGVGVYGRDLSLEEMLEDPWFASHFDYGAFLGGLEEVFGRERLRLFAYGGDTVEQALRALGVDGLPAAAERARPGLGTVGIALLRTLNRFDLAPEARQAARAALAQADAAAGGAPFRPSPAAAERVRALAAEGLRHLEAAYGLRLGERPQGAGRVRRIVTAPDPVLRRVCAPVATFDQDLQDLSRDMLATMYDAPGRGLAAPQVGLPLRLFVMDTGWKEGAPDPQVFVNPEIVEASETRVTREEGCLSIPGRTSRVTRPDAVTLRWQDTGGAPREGRFEGFAATCAQHEIDHLDGILCIDREEPAAGAPGGGEAAE